MEISHPRGGATILTTLYGGAARSNYLVKKAQNIEEISEPTVYALLKELKLEGYVKKITKSSRNVQYELTAKGRRFVEDEHLKARDTLLSAIKNLPEHDEIILNLFLEEILKQIPDEWKTPEKRKILYEILEEEIGLTKKKLIVLAKRFIEK